MVASPIAVEVLPPLATTCAASNIAVNVNAVADAPVGARTAANTTIGRADMKKVLPLCGDLCHFIATSRDTDRRPRFPRRAIPDFAAPSIVHANDEQNWQINALI